MKTLQISWEDHRLSLLDALHQGVDLITGHYGSDWLVSQQPGEPNKPEWRDAEAPYEAIHELHSHSFMELCVCLEGRCGMRHNDEWLSMSAGEACLIPPGVIHAEMPGKHSPYKAIWIAADAKQVVVHVLVRDYARDLLLIEGSKFDYDLNLQFLLHHLKPEQSRTAGRQADLLKTYVMQLLLHTLEKLEEPQEGKRTEGWKSTVVKEIYDYVEKHRHRHIRLSEISQEQCISINHLNNIFKAATGKTIMRYMEENRMDKARRWLCESGDSVQEIAFKLGFYDPYHFSKAFKKETGLTPTQFRKSKDGAPESE